MRIAPTRVFSDEEERDINDLFQGLCNVTTVGITSFDRVLRRELKDTEKLLSRALEKSGGTVASLNEYVSVVERSAEDINVWSTVFETKLINIRKNIDVINGRDDAIKLSGENEQALTDALQQLEFLGESRRQR
jgi:hypothetical protein